MKGFLARLHEDDGFMGRTHSMSALAIYLLLLSFFPASIGWLFGEVNGWVVFVAGIIVVGAALIPDLDNTTSTAISTLGVFGDALSFLFRSTSKVIQTIIRGKRDDISPDPHRGFYHTYLAAILLGALVAWGAGSSTVIAVPVIGQHSLGFLFTVLIVWVSLQLAVTSFFGSFVKKLKRGGIVSELVALVVSLTLTIFVIAFLPQTQSSMWVGIAFTLGMMIHSTGDAFTVSGAPLFGPFTIFWRSKAWWDTCFLPIEAGKTVENWVLMPLFTTIAAISAGNLIYMFISK